jgi:hypothetical protein
MYSIGVGESGCSRAHAFCKLRSAVAFGFLSCYGLAPAATRVGVQAPVTAVNHVGMFMRPRLVRGAGKRPVDNDVLALSQQRADSESVVTG